MNTLATYFSGPDCSYGDRREYLSWLVLLTQHRDSDSLTRSNWRVARQRLGAESDHDADCGDSVHILRARHWAVGWVEYLLINPRDPAAYEAALEMESALANYPALDEDDWSSLQWDEREGWISIADVEMPPDSDPWSDPLDWQDWLELANASIPEADLDLESSHLSEAEMAARDGQLSL